MNEIATKLTEPTEYVQFWNDTLADKFDRFRHILMEGLSYHSRVPLERLTVTPGSRILDVGCGWGDTTIQLARKTGPDGYVLGVDCVDQFLTRGRADARKAGLDNIRFITEDVERCPFDQDFDLCFSRFGMMFFENPVRAMKNIRRALRPGGELMFIVWRRRWFCASCRNQGRKPAPVARGHSPWPIPRLCHSSLKSPGSWT